MSHRIKDSGFNSDDKIVVHLVDLMTTLEVNRLNLIKSSNPITTVEGNPSYFNHTGVTI